MQWFIDRSKEPSTFAGLAVGCVVIAMVTQWHWVALVGAGFGVFAILLKEKIV